MSTRRQFLETSLRAGLALPAAGMLGGLAGPTARSAWAARTPLGRPVFPDPRRGWRGDSSLLADLRSRGAPLLAPPPFPPERPEGPASLDLRFADLHRHFIFEYYPWYGVDPIVHWDQWDRVPPLDIAASSVPRLGPYDSRSTAVLEAHARWIVESGAGAVNLSWWGPGSWEDLTVHRVMDVFRAFDLRVTFHLEPYANDRAGRYVQDVLYLLREYGEKRRFDAFLVLKNADGREGPVFKSFRTILPREYEDCHGVTRAISDYTPDDEWRRQTDALRNTLRGDFDHLTLLADSLAVDRARAGGFDGIAIYDNFVPPSDYEPFARHATDWGLVFSFNVNPGYDAIEPRDIRPGSCYAPTPFAPPAADLDFSRPGSLAQAASLSEERIGESFARTMQVQRDPTLANARRGFLLVYLNSFNEWHEGHQFEPMLDADKLSPEHRALGYHNPERGDYRLRALTGLLQTALAPSLT